MKLRSCGATALLSESAIRTEVRRMLDACEIDGPPTPVERLLQFRKLSREDMTAQHGGLIRQFFRSARRFRRKVLGVLDVPARFIAVDPELHPKRQSFLTHHEIAHDALPWHREMLVVTSEWDLSPQVRTIFEAEANRFAGHSIFQIGHMAGGYRGRRLQIADLGGVAATYAASLSATARQYVIVQDIPAALLVGKPLDTEGARGIRFYDGLANEAYLREFDPDLLGWTLRPDHPLCACVNEPASSSIAVELRIPDRNREERVLLADALYTSHDVLILVHPVRSTRRLFGLSQWSRAGRAA